MVGLDISIGYLVLELVRGLCWVQVCVADHALDRKIDVVVETSNTGNPNPATITFAR